MSPDAPETRPPAPASPVLAGDPPVLQTRRLILRLPRLEDFDAYAEYMSDAESAQFLGGVMSRPVAWRSFLQLAGAWQLQGFSMFSVISKADGAWIGRVGPWMPEGWPGTEVGWGIVLAQCSRGYATEAAAAAIDWAFDTLGWEEVIHTIAPGNVASQAVAKKLGAELRGFGRLPEPVGIEVEIWGQTKAQWRRREARPADP